jgi:hypothetical protein
MESVDQALFPESLFQRISFSGPARKASCEGGNKKHLFINKKAFQQPEVRMQHTASGYFFVFNFHRFCEQGVFSFL